LFRILGAFQQRAFGSSTLIVMKIAKKLENRATVFTQSGTEHDKA
jgi:acetolactate synthase small subunit